MMNNTFYKPHKQKSSYENPNGQQSIARKGAFC
jgi:hypothetical protein